MLGAVIAFGIAVAFISGIREVTAAEAAVITAPGTAPVIVPQPLINRPQPVLSVPDARSMTVSSSGDTFFRTAPVG